MALNTYELWSNDIKIASFPSKLPSGWGLSLYTPMAPGGYRGEASQTPVWVTFEIRYFAQYVS